MSKRFQLGPPDQRSLYIRSSLNSPHVIRESAVPNNGRLRFCNSRRSFVVFRLRVKRAIIRETEIMSALGVAILTLAFGAIVGSRVTGASRMDYMDYVPAAINFQFSASDKNQYRIREARIDEDGHYYLRPFLNATNDQINKILFNGRRGARFGASGKANATETVTGAFGVRVETGEAIAKVEFSLPPKADATATVSNLLSTYECTLQSSPPHFRFQCGAKKNP